MPKIIFIEPSGNSVEIEAPVGISIMQAAIDGGVAGIIGECGGNAMCATCHVYVRPEDLNLLPPLSPEENALLDGTACEKRSNSRLSCQVSVTSDIEGACIELPERQI